MSSLHDRYGNELGTQSIAARRIGRCSAGGVAMVTISGLAHAIISAQSAYAAGTP